MWVCKVNDDMVLLQEGLVSEANQIEVLDSAENQIEVLDSAENQIEVLEEESKMRKSEKEGL